MRVIPDRPTIRDQYKQIAPQVEFVAASFLVLVLVFFLLQDREQSRDKLLNLYERGVNAADATVMVQKEVADRLLAQPGSKEYGVLSILVRRWADCSRRFTLPPVPENQSSVPVVADGQSGLLNRAHPSDVVYWVACLGGACLLLLCATH